MTVLRNLLTILVATLLVFSASGVSAQTAVLIADQMYLDANGNLVADGNVEAFHTDLKFTATKVVYSQTSDTLVITGPIFLFDQQTGTEFQAEAAELDPELLEGVMSGARLVLEKQLQLAAVELSRSEGRYTQLYKVAATSCNICGDDSPPIWQIRAKEVVHDAETRQLYFSEAQFLVLDMPVAVVPRLRMPDPTLKRSNGFLVPSGRSNTLLGIGIKVPYFLTLGDHRDVTITPYLSAETTTLEYTHRQKFVEGNLFVQGAFSRDALSPGATRYYVFANGSTSLPLGYRLSYDVEATSDTSYLLDYGYSGKDRLDSAISAARVERNLMIHGDFIHFQTLRETEKNATQPTVLLETTYQKRLPNAFWGGELRLNAEAHAHYRYSNENVNGRDVSRTRANAEWVRSDVYENGFLTDLHAQFEIGASAIAQDNTVDQRVINATPAAYASMRWPLGKTTENARFILEPVAQIAWSETATQLTNEESTRVEFDEANLLDFSRFPAADRVEEGVRLAYGTRWSMLQNNGVKTTLQFGQVVRQQADSDLSRTSGLMGTKSDWLIAGQLLTPNGVQLLSRGIFDENFSFSKAENRLTWDNDWIDVTATHLWLNTDLDEGRSEVLSEINLSTKIDLTRNWSGLFDWQYDLAAERVVRAGVGLEYGNECIDMLLSASRRFTVSSTVDPSTDYDFRIGLRGFGAGRSGSDIIRTCGS